MSDGNLERAISVITDKALRDDPTFKKAVETVIGEMLADESIVEKVKQMAREQVAYCIKNAVCAQIQRAVTIEMIANTSINQYIVQQTKMALEEIFTNSEGGI